MQRTSLVEVADRVYAVMGSGGMPNAAFIVTEYGVVCIDTRYSPAYAHEMLAEIAKVTSRDIALAINTHFHADHTFGNQEMPTDRIVAHAATLQRMAELGDGYVATIRERRPDLADELADTRLRLPTETISSDLSLHFGDLTIQIKHYGHIAHTAGDLVVLLPERDLVIAADIVFNGVMPIMRDGDIAGLRSTLLALKDDSYDMVLPGHGKIAGRSVLDEQLELIDVVTATVYSVIANGGGHEAAAQAVAEQCKGVMFADQRAPDWVRKVAATPRGREEKDAT